MPGLPKELSRPTIAAADAAAGEPRAQLHRCGTTYYSHDERQAEVRPEVADQRGGSPRPAEAS